VCSFSKYISSGLRNESSNTIVEGGVIVNENPPTDLVCICDRDRSEFQRLADRFTPFPSWRPADLTLLKLDQFDSMLGKRWSWARRKFKKFESLIGKLENLRNFLLEKSKTFESDADFYFAT
jgi:hypothetical protein